MPRLTTFDRRTLLKALAAAPLTIALPEGWEASPGPGVTAVIVAPAVEGRFRPNAVITHTRVPADTDFGDIVAASGRVIDALSGVVRGADRRLDGTDRKVSVREYAYEDERSGLGLYQVEMQALVPVGFGLADLVTLTGTCAGGQVEVIPLLRSIVESALAGPAPGST